MQKLLLTTARIICILLCCVQITYGQTRTVTGKVTDVNGEGIPGVTISVKGSTAATQTTADGTYRIEASPNATLVFSGIGFTSKELRANSELANVSLESASLNLDEIVVVGYGTARRRDLTGAVATVNAKDFNRGIVTSPDLLIQGKVPGVQIINNSGAPGGATTIKIRGNSSVRVGNQPLFVVDGIPIDGRSARPGFSISGTGQTPDLNPLNFINPIDIENIQVLKDASATAIFGSRGANGVVLVTTRKGQSGAPKLDINYSAGISRIMKRLDVLTGDEYRQALKNYNLTTGDYGSNVDALDEITRTAKTQNYNIAVGGGDQNGRSRLSLGYLDQQGIILKSGLKRYTGNLNGSYRFLESKRLGLDFLLIGAQNNNQNVPVTNDAGFTGSLVGQALSWNPTHPLRKPNDSIWIVDPALGNTTINPLAMSAAYNDFDRSTTMIASIAPSFRITDNLEYKVQYSVNYSTGNRRAELASFINIENVENKGAAYTGNNELKSQQLTHTLTFKKQFSENFNFDGMVGYEYLRYDYKGTSMSTLGFTFHNVPYSNQFQGGTQSSHRLGSFAEPTTELQSYFTRVNFNIKNKYLLTGTVRADGSSKFGANNRYGYFPSVGAAWNISNEEFLKDGAFSNLKLRVGWGRTGNQEFPAGSAQYRYAVTGAGSSGLINYPNENLKWQQDAQTNVGLDFAILDNRVTAVIDYFHKKTIGLLYPSVSAEPAPPGTKWINLEGEVVNKGLEIGVNTSIISKENLGWSIGVNVAFMKNNVTGLPTILQTGGLHGQGMSGTTVQLVTNNQPLNVYYTRDYLGLDKDGQAQFTDEGNSFFYMGDPNPKTLLGISSTLNLNKLTLVANLNGAFGHMLYNNTANSVLPIGNLGSRNIASAIYAMSQPEALSSPITSSSRYLEKGDYLKLANLTLTYAVGNLAKTFKNLNIFVTGQNLLVFTKYTGFDPEVNTDKQVGGVPSIGIEYTPYPSARSFLAGFNFSL